MQQSEHHSTRQYWADVIIVLAAGVGGTNGTLLQIPRERVRRAIELRLLVEGTY